MTATTLSSSSARAAQSASAVQPASVQSDVKSHPKKVIAVGDSLIYGYGDSEGGGWVDRLRLGWMNPEQPGAILYNLGVRGDGVVQVAKRLEREFSDRGELRHPQARHLSPFCGHQRFGQSRTPHRPARYRD